MTEELFRQDAYASDCTAQVVAQVTGADGEQGLILDRTVFYPTGGGQPGDRGCLTPEDGTILPVTDTRYDGEGRIVHWLVPGTAVPAEGATVTASIDWDRRHRLMRMHTCLHLLCSLIEGGVTGGSIGEEKGRLDFDLPEGAPDKQALTDRLNALVAANHPLDIRWITDDELDAQPDLVRTMSVKPPTGSGRVRLIEVTGVDLQPCGGTHVRATGEIGPVRVSKIEKKGKMNRRVTVVFEEMDPQ
ncbi:MAG: alanyl-tRNA editing protein [Rhodospirillum sp.]|nr:alanyl-tRNA editing protein [Rhodospirillum sp.]MCF8488827.1 alanyl-tRNA editing protein [Rhodospirillum sp.]MCF8500909.1 alanyl-tRNA editing protein [Rhodospirillum sp.]